MDENGSSNLRSEKRIKQDAKALSAEKGITHSAALDEIARSYGFDDFQAYKKALSDQDA